MMLLIWATLALMLGSSTVIADSLKDIEHVVIFMQENRSWDCVCFSATHNSKRMTNKALKVLWHHAWCSWIQ